MDAEKALLIANLLNTYGPKIVALVMKIRKDNGEEETIDLLESAGSKFRENIEQAQEALDQES